MQEFDNMFGTERQVSTLPINTKPQSTQLPDGISHGNAVSQTMTTKINGHQFQPLNATLKTIV